MESLIKIENLSKTFEVGRKKKKQTFTAVDNVSFEVGRGEIVGFIGPNGAGKSTTIKMMTGILHPSSGSANICGYTPWSKDRIKMTYHIGTMFGQKSSLYYHLPVLQSYKLLGAIYDIKAEVLDARIKEIADFFNIHELLGKKANTLSLGQRMICEVAAATLHRPDVIFFDEPTIGLDLAVKKKVRDMIRMLNNKYGTTILITSHDISDIEKLCNRIILINHGKIVVDSSLETFMHNWSTKKHLVAMTDSDISLEALQNAFKGYDVKVELDGSIIIEYDETIVSSNTVRSVLSTLGDMQSINVSNASLEDIIYYIYTNKRNERNEKNE